MVPGTEIKVNNKTDPDPTLTLHIDIHLVSCGNCGYKHPPRKCKDYKKECHKCGKEGHFAPLCRSRPKSTLRFISSTQKGNGKPQQHQSQCNAHEVDDHPDFQFDSVNIVSKRT